MRVLSSALFHFIDREIGFPQLAEHLVVSLDLRPRGHLEVWGKAHRWVGEWAETPS